VNGRRKEFDNLIQFNSKRRNKMKSANDSQATVDTKVYSPEEVAELMSVKKAYVLRMLREGHLKGFKMGKFWRVSGEQLHEFISAMSENGNGKRRMKPEAKEKIRFHTCLRSQDSLPKTLEELDVVISDLKDNLKHQSGHRRVATIARLQVAVQQREERKEKIGSMDETLNAIGSRAYPDLMKLADLDGENLESVFVQNAKSPGQTMLETFEKRINEMKAREKEAEVDEPRLAAAGGADH
jgi:excisionase family DNA binding protein